MSRVKLIDSFTHHSCAATTEFSDSQESANRPTGRLLAQAACFAARSVLKLFMVLIKNHFGNCINLLLQHPSLETAATADSFWLAHKCLGPRIFLVIFFLSGAVCRVFSFVLFIWSAFFGQIIAVINFYANFMQWSHISTHTHTRIRIQRSSGCSHIPAPRRI